MVGWFQARRRRRYLSQPAPPEWGRIIDDNVALARGLSPADHRHLLELVQIFIEEKHWEGCGGLELTEEMQVTIAAQACLLALGRDDSLYTDVASILVYPSTLITPPRPLSFFEQPRAPVGHGSTVIGEAMLGGPVVLAWDSVLAGGRGEIPGNVVIHEFAHKLDMETGRIDGTPRLPNRRVREHWATVCTAAYARHRRAVDDGRSTRMDSYGAKNEAEFFAVATEMYFTRPFDLAYEHPDLAVLLHDYYQFPFA